MTLRAPPPLGEELIARTTDRGAELVDAGGTLLAEARAADPVDEDVPAPVGFEAAERASSLYPWRENHPYPSCFVCGPHREDGDGLRIFPGPVEGARCRGALDPRGRARG